MSDRFEQEAQREVDGILGIAPEPPKPSWWDKHGDRVGPVLILGLFAVAFGSVIAIVVRDVSTADSARIRYCERLMAFARTSADSLAVIQARSEPNGTACGAILP